LKSENLLNTFLDKIISKLSLYSEGLIITYITFFVLLSSVPLVFVTSYLFNITYSFFLFFISVVLPLILTPITISLLLRLTKHLKHFKDELKHEVSKNQEKDILLFEQARFVLMGEMIANISHQWKQPLNTIGLSVVYAKTSDYNVKTIDNSFNIIEENIDYLASTIDDFMSFFDKRTSLELKSLHTIAKEIRSISSATISSKYIKLHIKIDDKNTNVLIASSISQVLLNLINNAKDAFDSEKTDKKIVIKFSIQKDALKISCCDNAGGIDTHIIEKIFDPYFTTKAKSQGTGIGLYMSKQIVQKLFNGDIKVDSKIEKTCFDITIPKSEKCKI